MKMLLSASALVLTLNAQAMTCTGNLLVAKTKEFGGNRYALPVTWEVEVNNEKSLATLKTPEAKIRGTIKDDTVVFESNDPRETIILKDIKDENETDKLFLDVKGSSYNYAGEIVSNVSGIISCQ